MGGVDTRFSPGPEDASEQDAVLLARALPSPQIGAVVRARRGLRSDTAIVIDAREGHAEVVWPSGEVATVQWRRIKEPLRVPDAEVRSLPGRLMRLLSSKDVGTHLTDQARHAIHVRLAELTQQRGHAVGLLLDREPLSLSIEDCMALPLEPWRIRYEFLAGGSSGTAELVDDIVGDQTAPLGVRAIVALTHARDAALASPEAELVFGSPGRGATGSELAAAATVLGGALRAAGVAPANLLKTAAAAPSQLAVGFDAAALLIGLDGRTPAGQRLRVSTETPASVVDDLIDRGIAVELAGNSLDAATDPNQAGLARYLRARLDPQSLTSADVLELQFGEESVRRYLSGDDSVRTAIPASIEHDIQVLRAAVSGGEPSAPASDPLIQELSSLLSSSSRVAPSELLLSDQSVWQVLIDAGVGGGAGGGPLAERFAGVSSLSRSVRALFEWRWDDARSIAKNGLRIVRREDVRDELLNVMACALWLKGDTEPALAALDTALGGEYTDALLLNASVVASELEHSTARERLVRIAREAPSAHQRAMAAERALILWINDDERIWEEDDETLPVEIRDSLRPLIREPLPEDRYLRIVKVLASHDNDWLARQPDSAFGANANSPSTRIFKARAAGLDDFAEALAVELKRGNHPEWVVRERDSVVEAAIEVLFERNDELSAAIFGLTLIDAGLPMPTEQRVPLKCLTVASIAANVDPEESEPNERFIDFIIEAHADLSSVDADDRERLASLVTIAAERLATAYFRFRYHEFDEAIDAYNAMMAKIQTIPSRNLNLPVVRDAFGPVSRFCSETWDIFHRLRPYLQDESLTEAVTSMMSQASDMGHRIAAVTR
jgi:hypothetical protein